MKNKELYYYITWGPMKQIRDFCDSVGLSYEYFNNDYDSVDVHWCTIHIKRIDGGTLSIAYNWMYVGRDRFGKDVHWLTYGGPEKVEIWENMSNVSDPYAATVDEVIFLIKHYCIE